MNILFAASECTPFAKTGGLADVVGSLPAEIKKSGIDVRVIMPLYSQINDEFKSKMKYITNFNVQVGWRNQYCGIKTLEYKGITFYFIDNEYYFKRDRIYGYYDDGESFAYFSRAVIESIRHIPFKPDIIHCNDWQTGLIPLFLKEQYRNIEFYKDIKTVYTIHNLKYQGVFSDEVLSELLNLDRSYMSPEKIEFYGGVSYMKAGLIYADIITTVSNTYANEIQYPFYGEKLEGVLNRRRNDLYGIVNGIDYEEYNPETDKMIFENYTASSGKSIKNKEGLQKLFGLPNRNIPIISMVSRLVVDKGFDLVERVFNDIIGMDVQFIILGTGSKKYEDFFKYEKSIHPDKVSANIEFNNELAHKIYAGSDIFLMPSIFEPCGLSQIIALRYGTVPVVRETGGLKDTIEPYNKYTGCGNGFSFANINAHDMLYTIQRAVKLYYDKEKWSNIVKSAMNSKYDWKNSAEKYIILYKKLL